MLPLRYDDLGTINAVKLLPIIDEYNGYIKLYTEIDSHIEEGDNVFITYSGNTELYDSDIFLDNYLYINQSDDYIYHEYSTGYEILYVDKNINTIVINRKIETLPPQSKLYDHYISKISAQNININDSKIDSSLFTNINISSNIEWVQGVVLGGDISNIIIKKKYDINYTTLKLTYSDPTYNKSVTLNNDSYGYSYFYNLPNSITNCDVENGLFHNCRITGDNIITNGFFEECNISSATINDGYYKNTILDSCLWYYGNWESNNSNEFTGVWNDGMFLNGIFSSGETTIWKNGYFIDGVFEGRLWEKGKFKNGHFKGATWYNGINTATTLWEEGQFNGGLMDTNINILHNIIHNGGTIKDAIISNGNFINGIVENTTIKSSIINGNTIFNNSDILNSELKSGTINNSNLSDDKLIDNIIVNDSVFLANNSIKNGNFKNNKFVNPIVIDDGDFYGNKFKFNEIDYVNFNISGSTGVYGTITSIYLGYYDASSDEWTSMSNKILIKVDKNHFSHFFDNASPNKIIYNLSGFENIELNKQTNNSGTLKNPEYYTGSVYSITPRIGDDYIILKDEYKPEYEGMGGFIYSETPTGHEHIPFITERTIINGGRFETDEFVKTTINGGEFYNTYMHNDNIFNDGDFRGGRFSSDPQTEQGNTWNGGNFYDGKFGNRKNGTTEEHYVAINSGGTKSFSNIETDISGIILENIYPLLRKVSSSFNPGLNSWTTTTLSESYENLPKISHYGADMNLDVWSGKTTITESPGVDDFHYEICSYKIVFKIKADTVDDQRYLIFWINSIIDKESEIQIFDKEFMKVNPISATTNIYETFNDLYDNGDHDGYVYDSHLFDDSYLYITVKSNHCEQLYNDASVGERSGYLENFRNNWSVANTGYYTHPLPVLSKNYVISGGTEDISGVTNYIPTYYNGTGNEDKWIYGSPKPPWTLKHTVFQEEHWNYEKDTSELTKITTPSTFNFQPVEQYDIHKYCNETSQPICFNTLSGETQDFLDYVDDLSLQSSGLLHEPTFNSWMTYHRKWKNISGSTSTGTYKYSVPMALQNNGDTTDIYHINMQDGTLFDAYYRYRRGENTSISIGLDPNNNTTPIYGYYYEKKCIGCSSAGGFLAYTPTPTTNYFLDSEMDDFERWNEKIQTSILNFNRESGIQFKADNKPVIRSAYIDTFKGGTIYNTNFFGIWSGGSWLQGNWEGWNDLKQEGHELESPQSTSKINKNIKIPYYENKQHLLKEKKYYDVAPWDTIKKDDLIISKNIKNKKY